MIQQVGLGLVIGVILTLGIIASSNRPGEGTVRDSQQAIPPSPEAFQGDSPEMGDTGRKEEYDNDPARQVPGRISPRQREEIRYLQLEVANLERRLSGEKTLEEKMEFAKQTFEMLQSSFKDGDFTLIYEIFARLNELDEDVAIYFYDRYQEDRPGEEKEHALFLSLFCGGPRVSEMLKQHLQSDPSDKNDSMLEFAGYFSSRIKPFPLDDELAQIARKLTQHPSPKKRKNAVFILSQHDSELSRQRLQVLVLSDPDKKVRGAAIQALGLTGNRESLTFLETRLAALDGVPNLKTYFAGLDGKIPDPSVTENATRKQELEQAIRKIKSRHPE